MSSIDSLEFRYQKRLIYSLLCLPNYIIKKTPAVIYAETKLEVKADPSYTGRYPIYNADLTVYIDGCIIAYVRINSDTDMTGSKQGITINAAQYQADVGKLLQTKSAVIRISGVCTDTVNQTFRLQDSYCNVYGVNCAHYYESSEMKDGVVRVYNDGNWVCGRIKGVISELMTDSGEHIINENNEQLYSLENTN